MKKILYLLLIAVVSSLISCSNELKPTGNPQKDAKTLFELSESSLNKALNADHFYEASEAMEQLYSTGKIFTDYYENRSEKLKNRFNEESYKYMEDLQLLYDKVEKKWEDQIKH